MDISFPTIPEQHKLVGRPLSNVGSLDNRCATNLCCSGFFTY